MSFTRFSKNSDVYSYRNMRGRYICCSCKLHSRPENRVYIDFSCDHLEDLIKHLLDHVKVGHKVLKGDLHDAIRRIGK